MALGRAMPWPLKAVRFSILRVVRERTSTLCSLRMDGIKAVSLISTTQDTLIPTALRLTGRDVSSNLHSCSGVAFFC